MRTSAIFGGAWILAVAVGSVACGQGSAPPSVIVDSGRREDVADSHVDAGDSPTSADEVGEVDTAPPIGGGGGDNPSPHSAGPPTPGGGSGPKESPD